jgi:D-glycero-alpha-D-manno-heptose-7-phosphate kinase
MIITRTPLRISIGGGGTDLPSYYEQHGGFVISAAINKYIYITANTTFRPGYFLKYSRTEQVDEIDDIEHGLLRETIRKLEISPEIEIVSIADVPAGTGLGSSGSFTVGLLNTLYAYKRQHIGTRDLAAEAFHMEATILGEPCGKQDQYIAAYGGIMCQDYHPDGTVTMTPLAVSEATVRDLHENLMMFFTGYSRTAAEVLNDQKTRSENGDAEMLENLHFIKQTGQEIKTVLESGDTEAFASLMHEHWLRKQQRSNGISSDFFADVYEHARANGAVGGKLVGAGGGGFMLFYTQNRPKLRQAMMDKGMQEMDFAFDFDGSVVLLRN